LSFCAFVQRYRDKKVVGLTGCVFRAPYTQEVAYVTQDMYFSRDRYYLPVLV
jgi:hypothetical protein